MMSSEYDVDPKIELGQYTAELKRLCLDPKKNAVRIQVVESAVYHLRKRIAELDRMIYVGTRAGGTLIAHADPNPNRLPEIRLGLLSTDEAENVVAPEDLMRVLRELGKKLPDEPEYAPYNVMLRNLGNASTDRGTTDRRIAASFATSRWEWSRQRHGEALNKLRDHIKANRTGEALLSVWNIAVGFSKLSAQASAKEGADRLKRKISNISRESGKNSHGTGPTRDAVRAEVETRLLKGEEWDAVVDDILSRPYPPHPETGKPQFKTGKDSGPQEWPPRATFTKRWLNGLNPHKPGPRKKKAAPALPSR